MTIKMKTEGKSRLIIPEIIVLDGKMYKPKAGITGDIFSHLQAENTLLLEEIESVDEKEEK